MARYSDDRMALAQEIAETLRSRGFYCPKDFAGPDLITAVGQALEYGKPVQNKEAKIFAAAEGVAKGWSKEKGGFNQLGFAVAEAVVETLKN